MLAHEVETIGTRSNRPRPRRARSVRHNPRLVQRDRSTRGRSRVHRRQRRPRARDAAGGPRGRSHRKHCARSSDRRTRGMGLSTTRSRSSSRTSSTTDLRLPSDWRLDPAHDQAHQIRDDDHRQGQRQRKRVGLHLRRDLRQIASEASSSTRCGHGVSTTGNHSINDSPVGDIKHEATTGPNLASTVGQLSWSDSRNSDQLRCLMTEAESDLVFYCGA